MRKRKLLALTKGTSYDGLTQCLHEYVDWIWEDNIAAKHHRADEATIFLNNSDEYAIFFIKTKGWVRWCRNEN